MNKIIIFSHDSDIDSLGCVGLCKLAFLILIMYFVLMLKN